jgi:anti-sigma-K factor RskA
MSCDKLRALSVSDDPADRELLEIHAGECTACAALLQEHRHLQAAVKMWKDASPAPPARLEARILAAARESGTGNLAIFPAPAQPRPASSGNVWRWALAAAAVLASLAVAVPLLAPLGGSESDLPRAVREVRQAERAYTRAIATLEREAAVKLARVDDPLLSGQQAVILLTYRDRLANLDSVIAEVRTFLDESPGNSGGHTVLLAAYKEKSEVLQEVIDLQLGDLS